MSYSRSELMVSIKKQGNATHFTSCRFREPKRPFMHQGMFDVEILWVVENSDLSICRPLWLRGSIGLRSEFFIRATSRVITVCRWDGYCIKRNRRFWPYWDRRGFKSCHFIQTDGSKYKKLIKEGLTMSKLSRLSASGRCVLAQGRLESWDLSESNA